VKRAGVDSAFQGTDRPSLANILAVLGAVAMFFSTLEFLIPKPVPFFRIGLANIPVLLVIRSFRTRDIFALTLLKVIGQGLINGTLASYVFLFSLFGSFASTAIMVAICRIGKSRVSLIGVSTAGALASNIVQIVLSVLFIFGPSSWIIAPPFLILGTIAGVFVGVVAEYFLTFSRWVVLLVTDYRLLVSGEG
jgi:heptaprenyl diphosphate synthase